jgi:oligopeptide/dipeptide ABC transporter ATP-binding protein|tara:strand:- start:313 stop:1338 length:1026 start_codon:yes stop_codon:yes gene_type:complete
LNTEAPANANADEAAEAPLLLVSDLAVSFPLGEDRGDIRVVDGISLRLRKGQTLGLVGESGCGKSVTALALLDLVPEPGSIVGGQIIFDGTDLRTLPGEAMRNIRGNRIAMVFQEPGTALNPVFSVGAQIAEAYRLHHETTKSEARNRAIELLGRVGIPDPASRAEAYPHQLSGGMRQRCVIAMALICTPDLLIADEPTTALDTTIQAQILDLILDLQDEFGMAVLFISHNLATVSEVADDIVVMYAGRVAEQARREDLFSEPSHPYTRGLIGTLPSRARRGTALPTLAGSVGPGDLQISGCRFANRCELADLDCRNSNPPLIDIAAGHISACFKAERQKL